GPDRPQQPPRQALRDRHRRRGHPRVRLPPRRRRATHRADVLRRPAGRATLDLRTHHLPAGGAGRRAAPHPPRRGRPRLRLRASGPPPAPPLLPGPGAAPPGRASRPSFTFRAPPGEKEVVAVRAWIGSRIDDGTAAVFAIDPPPRPDLGEIRSFLDELRTLTEDITSGISEPGREAA